MVPESELATSKVAPVDLQHCLENLPDAVIQAMDDRIVYANRAAAKLLGAPEAARLVGRLLLEFVHPVSLEPIRAALTRPFESECRYGPARHTLVRADGVSIEVELSAMHIRAGERALLQLSVRAPCAASPSVAAGRKRLLDLLADGAPLDRILSTTCHVAEELLAGASCSILRLTADDAHLSLAAAPTLPDEFKRGLDRLPIGANAGSCGTAAWRRQNVIVSNAHTDPLWDGLRDLPARFGFRACWSVPIIADDDELLGTLGIYFRDARAPSGPQLELLDTLQYLAGLAIRRQRRDARRTARQARDRSMLDALPQGILLVGRDRELLYANRSAEQILGAGTLRMGQPIDELSRAIHDEHGRPLPLHLRAETRSLADGLPRPERIVRLTRLDGSQIWLSCGAQPLRHGDGEPPHAVMLSLEDVTSVRDTQRQLSYLAHHDPLTGLMNRAAVERWLAEAVRRAVDDSSQVGVLFIDLDRFKQVNDTLGHRLGDELLREVGARLRHCVRDGDCIGRLGGDEFIIVLPEPSGTADLEAVAERVLRQLARPFVLQGHEFVLGASIGISIAPHDTRDPVTLIQHADTAMYHAKQLGRQNYQFYTSALGERAARRYQIESALRQALPRGELELLFQPKAGVRSGRIESVEALLRWNSLEFGPTMPDDFVRVAEETGLIVPIGVWVLQQACQQIALLQPPGRGELAVAVNLSARQLSSPTLVADVARALESSGLPGHLLELELTESMLIDHPQTLLPVLEALRALGVTLTVDDFGTGYSSLSYLQRFPLSALKIDRSFVERLPEAQDAAAITRAIIAMARAMGMRTVAEGVETRAQLAALQQLDCDAYQGFLLSEPLALDALRQRLDAG
ncbi:MAG: EAL domain-containing protein [Burkholderiaceae bacterium]